MRVFFNLFVLRSLLYQRSLHETRLEVYIKPTLDGTTDLLTQLLSPLKTLDLAGDVPNTQTLLDVRDNCHNLKKLAFTFENSTEEHYPLFLDIVKANPKLTHLRIPWSNEIADAVAKTNHKLKSIDCYPASSNITLRQITDLFASKPSLVEFDYPGIARIYKLYNSLTLNNNNNSNEEGFQSLVELLVRLRVNSWRMNYCTNSMLNEILKDKKSAKQITTFGILNDACNLTLETLAALFTTCTQLVNMELQKSTLSSQEFDELFKHIPKSLRVVDISGANLTVSNVIKLLNNNKNLDVVSVGCEDKILEDSEALESLKTAVKSHSKIWSFKIYRMSNKDVKVWSYCKST